MYLNFLGRDSCFGDEHNSAYFCPTENELVIIDCPVSTFQKLRKSKFINLEDYEKIYILITHTHGDHIGGLGLFVQYVHFVLEYSSITIIAPSFEVGKDIVTLLRIEGVANDWYKIMYPDEAPSKKWFVRSIPTKHSPQLEGKCFGYQLNINGANIVYTGDTSTLEPFYPYLHNAYLYLDTSYWFGDIHLKIKDLLEADSLINLLNANPKCVYLMHLDDVGAIRFSTENHKLFKIVETIK